MVPRSMPLMQGKEELGLGIEYDVNISVGPWNLLPLWPCLVCWLHTTSWMACVQWLVY